MHLNYFTVKAIANEWNTGLARWILTEAYSQEKAELSLVLHRADEAATIKISTAPGFRYFFRQRGTSKSRRNVAPLFEEARGCRIEQVHAAERDRMLFFRLSDGMRIQVQLFGPRPNIFLIADGRVIRAFQQEEQWAGKEPPSPRPAENVLHFDQFLARWKGTDTKAVHALTRAMPLFDRWMAREALTRAGLDAEGKADLEKSILLLLFEHALGVKSACENPQPLIFWDRDLPVVFSLTPLSYLPEYRSESFRSVDDALNIFVRKTLGAQQFRNAFDPLQRDLRRATERFESRADRSREELRNESRADQYERWGHLLMASPQARSFRGERITLPDVLDDGSEVEVPLDKLKSVIENAQQYYDKARKSRQARSHAETRVKEMEKSATRGRMLLRELKDVHTLGQLKDFQSKHAGLLRDYVQDAPGKGESVPFRRFPLSNEYEVWVGKNAKQNDALTFHHAGKHDYWFHARGLPGSHVILRRPDKTRKPPKYILEQAAGVAAHFSEARNSALVPVQMAERKHVRKIKGAPPGLVKLEREEVLLVEPRLPVSVG